MNEDIKQDWVINLTNGKYMQGEGELRTNNDEYCCLGVLCDRAVKAGIAKWHFEGLSGWFVIPVDTTWDGAKSQGTVGSATLPHFIVDWAGLENTNPYVKVEGTNTALSRCNDSLQLSFEAIAERIEADL